MIIYHAATNRTNRDGKKKKTAINKEKGSLEQTEWNSFISKQMQNAILIQL